MGMFSIRKRDELQLFHALVLAVQDGKIDPDDIMPDANIVVEYLDDRSLLQRVKYAVLQANVRFLLRKNYKEICELKQCRNT